MFVARRRRKNLQILVYKITFLLIKTMILHGFPKQNKGKSSKNSAFGHNFNTPHILFLGPAVN